MLWLITALVVAAPVTYQLDASQCEMVAVTSPEGLLAAASHGHAIEARATTGEIVYDADAPETSSVKVSAPTAMFINDEPATVKRLQVKNTLDHSDREKVARTLRSPEQLDVARFPTVSFTSTSVKKLPDGRLEVAGKLSIHGASVEVSLPVTVAVKDGVLTGAGPLIIKQTAFGITPFSIGLGTVKNADAIALHLKLVGKAK